VSEREKLPGIRENSIFLRLCFFLRKKIFLSPERSCGIASYAVFNASTLKVIVLKTGKNYGRG